MNGSESQSPPTTDPHKRKHSDGGPVQSQRSKRNRYISIACTECKRRKIRCNGENPCQRCGNLSLECIYAPNCCSSFKDSDEFKQMMGHISALQQQVDALYSNVSALRNDIDANVLPVDTSPYDQPSYSQSSSITTTATGALASGRHGPPAYQHPKFRGPTSSAFNLGVAKSSLQNMGITGGEDGLEDGVITHDQTPAASPILGSLTATRAPLHTSKDAIWSLSREEAVRLIRVWHDEMGTMYPIVDVERLTRHTEMLFTFMNAARRSGLMESGLSGADAIYDDQTILLKLVLSIALTLEASGRSEVGRRMWECVRANVEAHQFDSPDLKSLQILALAAMYHFHCDDESLAWRLIGQAARLSIELGLHRHETYATIFISNEERRRATILFWSIYVLDRRWSFGTGMPFAMQDPDIDPLLPKTDDTTPYLTAMIAYSAIGSRVWQRVANNEASSEEMGFLDYQVIQWHRSLPASLSYIAPGSQEAGESRSRSDLRLRINMYCRSHQMRILIYRPVLHTAASISDNLSHAHTVVDVARDTIRVLKEMDQTSDLYRTQQVMFNYFLISALAVLFLAVSHAPSEFSEVCRDEFYMALDLVRGMKAHSYVSKRLWRTIKVLKEVGPKLGLNVRNSAVDAADAHSTAANALAGLAGHPVDELALFGNSSGLAMNDSPDGMANDLTSLFEAAGGYASIMAPNEYGISEEQRNGGALLNQQDELSRILRDLF